MGEKQPGRFSLKGEEEMNWEIKRIREEGQKAGKSDDEITKDIAGVAGTEYAALIKAYSEIQRGGGSEHEIKVPPSIRKDPKEGLDTEEKYSLKTDPDDYSGFIQQQIAGKAACELTNRGISVYVDMGIRRGLFITRRAFGEVCVMLDNERAMLHDLRNKTKRRTSIISALCVIFAALSLLAYSSYQSAVGEIARLKADKASLTATVSELNEQKERSDRKLDEYKDSVARLTEYKESVDDEYNFFHEHAVIVTTAGEKYHEYGCYHIRNRSFYIFNTENAIHRGYTPCLDCIG